MASGVRARCAMSNAAISGASGNGPAGSEPCRAPSALKAGDASDAFSLTNGRKLLNGDVDQG